MSQCSERAMFSVTRYLDFFFLSLRSLACWSRVKVPGEGSSGDGGTASTSLMPGVGGIQLGKTHNGEQD